MGFCFLLLPQPSRSLRPAFVPDHPAAAHSYPPSRWGGGGRQDREHIARAVVILGRASPPVASFRAVLSPGGALLAFRNWEMQPGNAV